MPTGHLVGGGPSQWATCDHIRASSVLYATPSAARTFNDDLDYVQREIGVCLVSEDEACNLNGDIVRLELKDFDYPLIAKTFAAYGVPLEVDVVAVCVFDHGNAPPGYSDRQFRFDYLDALVRRADCLSAFAHRAEEVPPSMTRLRAVVDAARAQDVDVPLLVMDTAPAAVLGATLDPVVAKAVNSERGALIANIGNFHRLAFRLNAAGIGGLFEHHTSEVNRSKLERLLAALADSTLRHADVSDDMGHGALVYHSEPMEPPYFLAVTGPRRSLMRGAWPQPYFAVPYGDKMIGDMMIARCFGLLAGLAEAYPEFAGPIRRSLAQASGVVPWETLFFKEST
ncbi:MAG: DUF1786 domain-containing protein [Anaerolineales bacterium]|nr:DUF1786 domain-containing protein [Anaerolineales bacterium]